MTDRRITDIWLAIRDHPASTPSEIAARLPDEYGPRQVGPILFVLHQRGWIHTVGRGLDRRYVNARHARWT